jgi:hypothetical protein
LKDENTTTQLSQQDTSKAGHRKNTDRRPQGRDVILAVCIKQEHSFSISQSSEANDYGRTWRRIRSKLPPTILPITAQDNFAA